VRERPSTVVSRDIDRTETRRVQKWRWSDRPTCPADIVQIAAEPSGALMRTTLEQPDMATTTGRDGRDGRILEAATAASVSLAVGAAFVVLGLQYGGVDPVSGFHAVQYVAGAALVVQAPRAVLLSDRRRRTAVVLSVPGVLLTAAGLAPGAACLDLSAPGDCVASLDPVLPVLVGGLAITAASLFADLNAA
jgi:hypothetical protein